MTAIAGVTENGRVWIGGDSAGVGGYSLSLRADPKVFKLGEFLIGYTSSFRMAQIIRYHTAFGKPTEGQDAFEYMVMIFVPAIRKTLKDYGYLATKDNRESAGTFLVGWRGKLYCIESDLQVGENQLPYAACGCGCDLVLGSLHTTAQFELSPKERIKLALDAAESFSAGVRRPFVIQSV